MVQQRHFSFSWPFFWIKFLLKLCKFYTCMKTNFSLVDLFFYEQNRISFSYSMFFRSTSHMPYKELNLAFRLLDFVPLRATDPVFLSFTGVNVLTFVCSLKSLLKHMLAFLQHKNSKIFEFVKQISLLKILVCKIQIYLVFILIRGHLEQLLKIQ